MDSSAIEINSTHFQGIRVLYSHLEEGIRLLKDLQLAQQQAQNASSKIGIRDGHIYVNRNAKKAKS